MCSWCCSKAVKQMLPGNAGEICWPYMHATGHQVSNNKGTSRCVQAVNKEQDVSGILDSSGYQGLLLLLAQIVQPVKRNTGGENHTALCVCSVLTGKSITHPCPVGDAVCARHKDIYTEKVPYEQKPLCEWWMNKCDKTKIRTTVD